MTLGARERGLLVVMGTEIRAWHPLSRSRQRNPSKGLELHGGWGVVMRSSENRLRVFRDFLKDLLPNIILRGTWRGGAREERRIFTEAVLENGSSIGEENLFPHTTLFQRKGKVALVASQGGFDFTHEEPRSGELNRKKKNALSSTNQLSRMVPRPANHERGGQ